jgi:hypothetical protein|tara:strand:- start:112 stop:708 length:597 start_codon:yes stop_codon:yes gene_type:complete
MFTIFSILAIAIGAGLLYFGLKWYGTSLAIGFFVPVFMFLAMFDFLSTTSAIVLLVLTTLIFFLSRPLTYFVAFGFIGGILVLLLSLLGIEPGSSGALSSIPVILGIVAVWFIRTHLRALNIGIAGGWSMALGLNTFFFGSFQSFEDLQASIVGFTILTLLFMIGGVLFQYLYIIPRQEITPEETSEEQTETTVEEKD